MSIETRIFYLCYRVDLSVTQDFFVKIGGKRIVFNLEPIFEFHKLVKSYLGVSQRATATNILAVSQANSSNNYIPGYISITNG
jgi:hypothetical protein